MREGQQTYNFKIYFLSIHLDFFYFLGSKTHARALYVCHEYSDNITVHTCNTSYGMCLCRGTKYCCVIKRIN